jgi:hypothetical protein
VDCSCGIDYVGRVLLRKMHFTRPLWSFDSAFWNGKKYLPGRRVSVRVAWYGGPEIVRRNRRRDKGGRPSA